LYLHGITTSKKHGVESGNSKNFKREILDQLLKAMEDRGLENQIDCIAYSAGFPTRFNFHPELSRYLKQTGQKYQIRIHAPWASITSLTYFHRNAFSKRPNFVKLDANHFANPRRMKVLANPFTGKAAKQFDAAMSSMSAGNFERAIDQWIELGRIHREQVPVIYALARCFAFEGENKRAIALLNHAKELGFASKSLLERDPAFAKIRTLPDFTKITTDMEDLPDGLPPTRSFSGQKYWAKNGWASGTSDQGERYLLSSVLAVTGKNQSTVEASLRRLEASARADGTAPKGNVYFADHKDVRSKTRRRQFPFATQELESLGRTASIGSDIYPIGDQRVIGATLGSAAPKWSESNSQFLPGAICDNLTSYGAIWEKAGQTQITEWLDAGAAGASGTVYEPWAMAAKFPDARWHAHYARGCTLAESYYQSVTGPFQLLLVGDPLCCPFGKFPKFEIKSLSDTVSVTGDFEIQIDEHPDSPEVSHYDVFFDGVFVSSIEKAGTIPVETDAMSDGHHELRIVGVARSPTANKTSHSIGFAVNQKGHSVQLSVNGARLRIGQRVTVTARSSTGDRIQIRQNSRTITTLNSGKSIDIETSKLGLGKSKLQAVAVIDNRTLLQSVPIKLEIVH
jgi:hypothetical protein